MKNKVTRNLDFLSHVRRKRGEELFFPSSSYFFFQNEIHLLYCTFWPMIPRSSFALYLTSLRRRNMWFFFYFYGRYDICESMTQKIWWSRIFLKQFVKSATCERAFRLIGFLGGLWCLHEIFFEGRCNSVFVGFPHFFGYMKSFLNFFRFQYSIVQ